MNHKKLFRSTGLTPLNRLVIAVVAVACLAVGCGTLNDQSEVAGSDRPATSTVLTIPEEAAATIPGEGAVGADPQTSASTIPIDGEEQRWSATGYELLKLAEVDFPTALTSRAGSDDLWLTERPGVVRQIQRRASSDGEEQAYKLMRTIVLDITDKVSTEGEGGLLGLAFSSDGQYLYVSYTNLDGNSVVAEYGMDTIVAIPSTERILLEVEQPFANHNGGAVALGPDGFLYVALGDGGSGGDPLNHGQNPETLLGTILRIDPLETTAGLPYAIPADNPFADGRRGRPEVWLYGVRNPWQFSFDRIEGHLWIGDVGQNKIEEINRLVLDTAPAGRGANLGWRALEGTEPFDGSEPPADAVPPIYTYDHDNGRCSVTGGYVYRGKDLRELTGVYLFGDFCSGELFGLEPRTDTEIVVADLVVDEPVFGLVGFGQDSRGELYTLQTTGEVALLIRPGAGPETRILGPNEEFTATRSPESVVTDGDQTTTTVDN